MNILLRIYHILQLAPPSGGHFCNDYHRGGVHARVLGLKFTSKRMEKWKAVQKKSPKKKTDDLTSVAALKRTEIRSGPASQESVLSRDEG